MFIPAVAAWFLFQGLKQETTKGIKRIESQSIKTSKARAAESLTGFEGKGTFYRHLARVKLGLKDLSYTSAFYYLNQWHRDETDTFHIDGLLVVQNPKPRSLADLDGLLKISNAEPSKKRQLRLRNARLKYNSLTAVKARASGGKSVTSADHFILEDGVEAIIPNKDTALPPYRVKTTDAELHLSEGNLQSLSMPKPFLIETPTHEIRGEGMEGLAESSRLVIAKDPLIQKMPSEESKQGGYQEETLSGDGPLSWAPDDVVEGEPRAILNRTKFDFGRLELANNVKIETTDIEVTGDLLSARVGDEDGVSNPGRINQLKVEGHVRVKTPNGDIRGDVARIRMMPDGAATIWVEGERVVLNWAKVSEAPSKKQQNLHAQSAGPLSIKIPETAERSRKPLEITMSDDVDLNITDHSGTLTLHGEYLVVDLSHLNLVDENRKSQEAWRLSKAVLRGHVSGSGPDMDIETAKLTVTRNYEKSGALKDELMIMEGPAKLTRPGGLGRYPQHTTITTTIAANRKITYFLPASPFIKAKATASGHVVAKENNTADKPRRIMSEWIEIVMAPREGKKGAIETLEAKDSVDFSDENRSRLTGDRLWLDRPVAYAELEGAPALLEFYNHEQKRQFLRAPKIELHTSGSKLVADGGFDGQLRFRTAATTGKSNNGQQEPKDWTVNGDKMWAVFSGDMPLSPEPNRKKTPIRLAEVDLTGSVRIENPDQILTGENLHYDFRSQEGVMVGEPARLVSVRLVNGVRLRDWIEAPRVVTQPNATLFEGHSKARLNIKRQKLSRRDLSSWEFLFVSCTETILVRKAMAIFDGHCILERGIVAKGGLRLEADHLVARFAPGQQSKKAPQRLEKIEASGHVQLARNKLRGQGDYLDFDYEAKKVTMNGKKAPCRMWTEGGGTTFSGQTVVRDLEAQTTTVIRAFGKSTRKEGKN